MGQLLSLGPSGLPFELQEGANMWHALIWGVAIGQIVLGILYNIFAGENP